MIWSALTNFIWKKETAHKYDFLNDLNKHYILILYIGYNEYELLSMSLLGIHVSSDFNLFLHLSNLGIGLGGIFMYLTPGLVNWEDGGGGGLVIHLYFVVFYIY